MQKQQSHEVLGYRDHFEVEGHSGPAFTRILLQESILLQIKTGDAPFKREDSPLTNPKPPSIL